MQFEIQHSATFKFLISPVFRWLFYTHNLAHNFGSFHLLCILTRFWVLHTQKLFFKIWWHLVAFIFMFFSFYEVIARRPDPIKGSVPCLIYWISYGAGAGIWTWVRRIQSNHCAIWAIIHWQTHTKAGPNNFLTVFRLFCLIDVHIDAVIP